MPVTDEDHPAIEQIVQQYMRTKHEMSAQELESLKGMLKDQHELTTQLMIRDAFDAREELLLKKVGAVCSLIGVVVMIVTFLIVHLK